MHLDAPARHGRANGQAHPVVTFAYYSRGDPAHRESKLHEREHCRKNKSIRHYGAGLDVNREYTPHHSRPPISEMTELKQQEHDGRAQRFGGGQGLMHDVGRLH